MPPLGIAERFDLRIMFAGDVGTLRGFAFAFAFAGLSFTLSELVGRQDDGTGGADLLGDMAFAFTLARFSLAFAKSAEARGQRTHGRAGKHHYSDTSPDFAMLNHTQLPLFFGFVNHIYQ